jgi:enoyl reductase-like protein
MPTDSALEDPPEDLPTYGLHKDKASASLSVESMDQAQLLALHSQIEGRLEGIRLKDVNLVREALIQLQKAKALQAEANQKESGTPVNQRAQVQNSLANILQSLARIQDSLHNSESIKRLKAALVKALKTLPTEQQEAMFAAMGTEIDLIKAEIDA